MIPVSATPCMRRITQMHDLSAGAPCPVTRPGGYWSMVPPSDRRSCSGERAATHAWEGIRWPAPSRCCACAFCTPDHARLNSAHRADSGHERKLASFVRAWRAAGSARGFAGGRSRFPGQASRLSIGLALGDLQRLLCKRVALLADRPQLRGKGPHRVRVVIRGHRRAHQRGFADELRDAAALAFGRFLDQLHPVAGEADRRARHGHGEEFSKK